MANLNLTSFSNQCTPDETDMDPDSKRILMVYGSRTGSTVDVAYAIARSLNKSGHMVEVKTFDDVAEIEGFDAVVIGSPIQYDRWLPEAMEFVNTHHRALAACLVAGFFTCLTLSRDKLKAYKQAEQYADRLQYLHPDVRFLDIGRFAGVLDYQRLNPLVRPLARILFFFLGVKEGDYRDWAMISEWALKLHRLLHSNQDS